MRRPLNPSWAPAETGQKRTDVELRSTRSTIRHPTESKLPVQQRNVHCDAYGFCLDVAIAEEWAGFNCSACPSHARVQEVETALLTHHTERPGRKAP